MGLLDPLKVKVEFDLSALDGASDEALGALADKLYPFIVKRMLRAERMFVAHP